MIKWVLLAVALLFLGSLADDLLFVHQETNNASLETEHSIPFVLAFGLFSAIYFGTRIQLFFGNLNSGRTGDNSACYFCGWHNSAYLEASVQ